MKFFQVTGIAPLVSSVASSPACSAFTIGKEVNTTSGLVSGHAATNRIQVSEYLGIPFAKPPVDDLRFAAPQPYHSNKRFNASNFGTTCLSGSSGSINYTLLTADGYHLAPTAEQFMNINAEQGLTQGEDCLTLNVWTKPQVGEKAKAVLFFIHGGGFQGGYSSDPFGLGDVIAEEQDVIVITANYRANVFGFPGLQPEVSGMAPNAGLLDQRLAVEWARDNVAAFGGDPTRITLFGQSAGSASISMYGFAYTDDPIVNGLITQSGTADSFGQMPLNTTATWQYMSGVLGCGNSSSGTSAAALMQSVACVRSKTAAEVLAASLEVPLQDHQSALGAFAPTADGTSVFSNYSTLMDEGRFVQVPRLLGNTAHEGRYFQLQFALAGVNLPDSFWDFYTLVTFTCATLAAASGFATLGSQKVWRYMYSGDYPNIALTVNPSSGAYHGAELRPLFGYSSALGIPDTSAERAVGRLMRTAWAAFAKDPDNGLAAVSFSWPAYSASSTARIVEIGIGNATTPSFQTSAGSDDDLCPLLMPGFEAIGGENGMVTYGLLALPELQALQYGNVTQVLDILLEVAGLGSNSSQ